jgi:hypothetical protein
MEKVILSEKTGVKVRCNCRYEWVYTGKSKFWATCPRCRSTVVFTKAKERKRGIAQLNLDLDKNSGHVQVSNDILGLTK